MRAGGWITLLIIMAVLAAIGGYIGYATEGSASVGVLAGLILGGTFSLHVALDARRRERDEREAEIYQQGVRDGLERQTPPAS